MHLYRLVHHKWAAQAFDGEGARLYGGRWNSKGQPCVYTAGSEALAILEILVHLNNRAVLQQFRLFRLLIPDEALLTLSPKHLPASWQQQPATADTASIGDNWLQEQASLALAVPSALAPREHNILLNPAYPGYSTCLDSQMELDFMPDPRLSR